MVRAILSVVRTLVPLVRALVPMVKAMVPVVRALVPVVRTLVPVVRALVPVVRALVFFFMALIILPPRAERLSRELRMDQDRSIRKYRSTGEYSTATIKTCPRRTFTTFKLKWFEIKIFGVKKIKKMCLPPPELFWFGVT